MIFRYNKVFIFFIFLFITSTITFCGIHEAAQNGDLATVKILISKEPESVNLKDSDGRTPLHWAARGVHYELMEFLIKTGVDVNAVDLNGVTALHSVAVRGHVKAVELLVNNRANINLKDNFGMTPLRYALDRGHDDVINVLVRKGVELPEAGEDIRKWLHDAAAGGHRELVEALIKKGADIHTKNDYGGTLLHSAAAGGSAELVKSLIEGGFELNRTDRYGWTPLHWAALRGKMNIIQILLEKGADVNLIDPSGMTALHLAEENGLTAALELLQTKGEYKSGKFPPLKGEYFGQEKPGFKPEILAPGIISTHQDEHGYISFSPDGREAYWTVVPSPEGPVFGHIRFMELTNDRWSSPRAPSFADQRYDDWYATPLPDGRGIVFASRRPLPGSDKALPAIGGMAYWIVKKTETGNWTDAKLLDPEIFSGDDFAMSFTKEGTIYFSSLRKGGKGSLDVWRSRFVNGKYTLPENLEEINTEYYEDGPFIAPDESFLIFESGRPGGINGSIDLYISFRKDDGSWSAPVNLGEDINSDKTDRWARVTPHGKYLFFGSNQNRNMDIYWVDAKIIENLKIGY